MINSEGGPTDDKPAVQAQAPLDPNTLSSAMNVRVTDVRAVYEQWRSRGGEFLTQRLGRRGGPTGAVIG